MTNSPDLSIRQFVDSWHVLCEPAPGRVVHSEPGLEFVFAAVPVAFFNVAILSGTGISGDQLRTLSERSRSWADAHAVPWMLIVTTEALADGVDASAVLEGSGYAPAMPLYGMLAQNVAPVARLPEGLTLQVAKDDAACAAVMDINAQAYGISLDAAKDIWGKADFWNNHIEVLGSVGDKKVSSTAVLMVSGYRYVALVATAPGEQRKGYADAAMRYALEVSRQKNGDAPTFLHATEAGRPVYERVGYQTIAHHVAYMDKKFLGGH